MAYRLWGRAAACGCLAMILLGCPAAGPDPPQTVAATEKKAETLEKLASSERGIGLPSSAATLRKRDVQAVDPAGTQPMDDPITCLSRTIYWEARGESTASMEAIASVVMNRLGHTGYPDTICKVVTQGREQGACQFSWWCDGRSDHAKDDDSYAQAKEIARKALNRQLGDRTSGALYFHQRQVTPAWSREYIRTAEIGEFVFYKPKQGAAK